MTAVELDWSQTRRPRDPVAEAIGYVETRAEVARKLEAEGQAATEAALCWQSFPYFLSRLKDDRGEYLGVWWHNQQWAEMMQAERLLCLMAARDHGKTMTAYGYILWRMWRHNRGRDGILLPLREDGSMAEGNLDVVYFTSVFPLALERFERIKQFMTDNVELFGELLPRREPGQPMSVMRDQWSKTRIRLRNHATLVPKSVGSSYRGPHPQLIVADDIVVPENSRSPLFRGRVWAFLASTIVPMAGPEGQLIVMGTPQHQEDALHRLNGKEGWRWVKFRAVDWENEEVLWPYRYNIRALKALQSLDPILFSREYQMDPRDDASSTFPWELTAHSLDSYQGLSLTFHNSWSGGQREPGDYVLGGMDLAISESAGADFTVLWIFSWNRFTGKRTLLWATRRRGLAFPDQVDLLKRVCADFAPEVICIENNHFQKWLIQHVAKVPAVAQRVFGHTTGIEKQSLIEGVPSLKLVLSVDPSLWVWPTGDADSKEFVDTFRGEAAAFGYADGKLGTVGTHDDTVMAWWLGERAVRMVEESLARAQGSATVTAEDMGVERVSIGGRY